MDSYTLCLVVVLCACLFDYLSGVFKAFATHTVCTSRMREGLCHKVAIIACEFLAISIEFATGYIDLGVELSGSMSALVAAAIVIMEVLSVYENLCAVNPGLKDNAISRFFNFGKGE